MISDRVTVAYALASLAVMPGSPSVEQKVEVVAAISRAYPPSAGNNPFIFAADLFSLMLVSAMAMATIVRLWSRTLEERLPCNHPVFYHRSMVVGLLATIFVGAFPNTLISLCWNEVEPSTMSVLMTFDKVMNTLTVVPFFLGLFVPWWVGYVNICGYATGPMTLQGRVHDLRTTWPNLAIPLRLATYCAVGAATVAGLKWYTWVG